jgi:predicted nucleic acid-binding protein
MRSDAGAAFFESRFLPLVFQSYVSAVVAEELYAAALDRQAIRLIEKYVGALERAGRVVAPSFQDWKQAGAIIARITRK